MRTRAQAAAGLGAWLAVLVVALVGLHAVGGPLAPPPLSHPGRFGQWLDQRQPVEAAFAVLRLVALALAWYLLLATAAGVAGRLLRLRPLVMASDLVTVPAVRRLVSGAVGVSLTASVLSGGPGAAAADSSATAPVAVMQRLPDADPASPPVTMRRLPEPAPPRPGPPAPAASPEPAPAASPEAVSAPSQPPPAPTWEVEPGHSFWSIAEGVLAEAWHRPPTDGEVVPYWRTLIEANRDRLRDPGNPHLLFPGQVLVVPPPPPPPPPPPFSST